MAPPLAHAGHYIVDLVYAMPMIVLIVVGLVMKVRDRRRGDEDGPQS
jgi:hypothetical protein